MSLNVTVRGEGPPVVLLHSGGMSGRQWRRLGDALVSTHRVIAPDFLGSGDNPPWPDEAPFHFDMDVAAVAEILAAEAAPTHVVGHSYGGLVALTLARKHSALVRSVAVYDPVAFGVLYDAADAEGLEDLAHAGDDPVFTDDARGGSEAWLQAFVDYWNGPGAWKAMPQPSREGFLRVGRKVFYEVRSLLADRTTRAAYASLPMPFLLMRGERSPAAARRVIALLAGAIPGATLLTLAGAGHMGPISHAAAVNEAIVRHVAEADGRSQK
ncbi:alpha/beta superfamily hydrolase [Minicystis rosea]|nr:alpha/beta superfamily hydrolase [Minicystis rosea]